MQQWDMLPFVLQGILNVAKKGMRLVRGGLHVVVVMERPLSTK